METCDGVVIAAGQKWKDGNGSVATVVSVSDTTVDGHPVVDNYGDCYTATGDLYEYDPTNGDKHLGKIVDLGLKVGQLWSTVDGLTVEVTSVARESKTYPYAVKNVSESGMDEWTCTLAGRRLNGTTDSHDLVSQLAITAVTGTAKPPYRIGQIWKGRDSNIEFKVDEFRGNGNMQMRYTDGWVITAEFHPDGRLSTTDGAHDLTKFKGYEEGFRPAKFEVGQLWKARNGDEWVVEEIDSSDADYPVLARNVINSGELWFTGEGFENIAADGRARDPDDDTPKDLLIFLGYKDEAIGSTESTKPAELAALKNPKWAIGQKYKTRDGRILTVTQDRREEAPDDHDPILLESENRHDGWWYMADGSIDRDVLELIELLSDPTGGTPDREFEVGTEWTSRNFGKALVVSNTSDDPDDHRPIYASYLNGASLWLMRNGRLFENSDSQYDLLYLHFNAPAMSDTATEDEDPWARFNQS